MKKLVVELIDDGVLENHIAIIAPYRAQVSLFFRISSLLNHEVKVLKDLINATHPSIFVNTVDGYQVLFSVYDFFRSPSHSGFFILPCYFMVRISECDRVEKWR